MLPPVAHERDIDAHIARSERDAIVACVCSYFFHDPDTKGRALLQCKKKLCKMQKIRFSRHPKGKKTTHTHRNHC
jgi:hypothetical protein